MPQFDIYSFSGQIFWTLLGFLIFYFFMLLSFMSPLGEIFLVREQLKVSTAKLTILKFLRLKKSNNSPLNLPFRNFF
jgi:hypothetical protein